jgi:prepilin-type N-terminal cleavage/methylation domain-containing protein
MKSADLGFTLIELIVVAFVASIVFLGIAALYAQAFRTEMQSLHQIELQNAATITLQSIHRTLGDSTYVIAPAAGASISYLQGYRNYANLGAGTWQELPAAGSGNGTQFIYYSCAQTVGGLSYSSLYFYETVTPSAACSRTSAGLPSGCPPPATWPTGCSAAGNRVDLVTPPVSMASLTFDHATSTGPFIDNQGVVVNVIFSYPLTATSGAPAVPSMATSFFERANAPYSAP